MYGLEKNPERQVQYDLEKEWKNPAKATEWRKKIDQHVETIKTMIRQGMSAEEFRHLESILQGYLALKKIMNRVK